MRADLIAYLKTQSLGTVSVTEETPWTKDGEPLYLKNFKRIYIDREQIAQEPLFNTLDGSSLVNQTTTLIAYLVIDAKNPLVNYETIVSSMKAARNSVSPSSKLDRTVAVAKSYEGDALVTEFTFEFRQLITT